MYFKFNSKVDVILSVSSSASGRGLHDVMWITFTDIANMERLNMISCMMHSKP